MGDTQDFPLIPGPSVHHAEKRNRHVWAAHHTTHLGAFTSRRLGHAKGTSAKLIVKQGRKTLAKNVPSAKRKAGKYSVTTTAKYKTWTMVTTSKTVTTKKLVARKNKSVTVTCKFKNSVLGMAPLGYFIGDPAEEVVVDVVLGTTAGGRGILDGSFGVQGINAPDTARNIALDAEDF